MEYVLLIGAMLNYSGSLLMLKEVVLTPPSTSAPEEYYQLKLFVIGVAATFGSIYVYLFFNTDYIFPFLIFGTVLKAWAFITCIYLYVIKRITAKLFFKFGVLNGVVAIMFMALLVSDY